MALINLILKSDSVLEFEKKNENSRKAKGYFFRLLEMQMRKTSSDKRREIFGLDPLRVKE
jgi:hypothetical protein